MRFVLLLSLLCISAPAIAGIPCEELRGYTEGGYRVALISPAGIAPSLAEQGIVIHVEIMDCTPAPIVNFPAQDIWVDDMGTGEISLCPGGSIADANTDEYGHTTISGPIYGGGHSEGGTLVWVNGLPADGAGPMPLNFVSPDIDGDLDVDLYDFTIFGMDYGKSGVARSDLVPDGIISLYDFSAFGQYYGESCP